MQQAIGKVIEAAKGSKDLLAFIFVGLIGAVRLATGGNVYESLAFSIVLAAIWVVMRYGLARLHARERLDEFRETAKRGALEVLAKRLSKDDIRGMIEHLTKGDD